jgi:hypothetical protein
MNKLIKISIASLALALSANAGITISGTILENNPGLADGQTAVYIDAASISAFTSLGAGLSTTDSATYAGYTVIGNTTAITDIFFGGTQVLGGAPAGLSDNTIATPSNLFAVVVYANSGSTTIAGDTFQVFTDASFIVPADGGTFTGSGFSGAAVFSGSVVPEPSTFAALAGLCALGAVMVRRRRA